MLQIILGRRCQIVTGPRSAFFLLKTLHVLYVVQKGSKCEFNSIASGLLKLLEILVLVSILVLEMITHGP